MSYDLYFYKKKDSRLTEEKLAEYLTEKIPGSHEPAREWTYENPETGVYFVIQLNEPDLDEDDGSFAGYEYLNLNASINFIRPQYFGFEVFPVIEKMIDDLDLYVLNGQDETDADQPFKFPEGYFCEQWIRHNDRISAENFTSFNLKYMPPEKAREMWQFSFNRAALKEKLGDGIFVTGFFILQNAEDLSLHSVTVWPQHIPVVLPPCDYIIIKKKYKSFFREKEESGLVPYATVMKELGHYFDDYEEAGAGVKILTQANADAMAKAFNKLEIFMETKAFGKMIEKDGFVNVLPV